jgi:hypothetical protein
LCNFLKAYKIVDACFLLSSEHGVKQRQQGPDSHRVDCQQAGTGMQVRYFSTYVSMLIVFVDPDPHGSEFIWLS